MRAINMCLYQEDTALNVVRCRTDYLLDWGRQRVSCSSRWRWCIAAAATLPSGNIRGTDVTYTTTQTYRHRHTDIQTYRHRYTDTQTYRTHKQLWVVLYTDNFLDSRKEKSATKDNSKQIGDGLGQSNKEMDWAGHILRLECLLLTVLQHHVTWEAELEDNL